MASCHEISFLFFFFFNDTATTEIYTLSLHDALPISHPAPLRLALRQMELQAACCVYVGDAPQDVEMARSAGVRDRKSTRLNSSHSQISYAVFCLKKKKEK